MSMLVLYHAPHSTCSQKVRMVLHEKGVAFDEVRIDLAKKEQLAPQYLALNPNGVVPTLVDDGTPIIESSVICEYLDEKYPHNPRCRPTSSSVRECERGPTTSRKSPWQRSVFHLSIVHFSPASSTRIRSSSKRKKSVLAPFAASCFSAWA